MSTLTIRGCDEQLARELHALSRQTGQSINKLILEALKKDFLKSAGRTVHRDLDHLAGTWSASDLQEFEAATAGFESISPEDWK